MKEIKVRRYIDGDETEICDELKFTPEDILVKRDIDFINNRFYCFLAYEWFPY